MAFYVEDSSYHRLVETLRALRPDPLTGTIGRDEIVTALGEIADVWPVGILPDAIKSHWHDEQGVTDSQ